MAFRQLGSAHLTKFNSSASCNLLEKYSEFVDAKIAEKNSKPSHRTFSPSSFRCLRKQWFRIRGVQPDKQDPGYADQYLEFSAQIGTACHKIIQTNLKEMLGEDWIDVAKYIEEGNTHLTGCECKQSDDSLETFIEVSNPPIRFACDGIIRLNGEFYLLEIKTSEFSSFDELTDPKFVHIKQVEMYCSLLNLKKALFIYQDRQHGQMKCFEYAVPESNSKDILDKIQYVLNLVEMNVCPEALPKGDSWCTKAMCPYYSTCSRWGR